MEPPEDQTVAHLLRFAIPVVSGVAGPMAPLIPILFALVERALPTLLPLAEDLLRTGRDPSTVDVSQLYARPLAQLRQEVDREPSGDADA